jgi:hypothetical protein
MIHEQFHEVDCNSGPLRDRFQRIGRALLEDISSGRPLRRRDAVMLAREVLESELVRAAEAVLEADDASLCARVVELLRVALDSDGNPGMKFGERKSSIT